MKKVFLRIIKEFDFDEVASHLLIAGDLKGDCFACREIGLDYLSAKRCPQCGVEFRYIASRQSKLAGIKFITSLQKKRPDLICVELDDVMYFKKRKRAKDLFS